MKRCGKCGELLPEQDFYRRTASPDGLQHWCRWCQKGYMRVYQKEHPRCYTGEVRKTAAGADYGQYRMFEEPKKKYMVRFNVEDHNEVLNVLTMLKTRGVIKRIELN